MQVPRSKPMRPAGSSCCLAKSSTSEECSTDSHSLMFIRGLIPFFPHIIQESSVFLQPVRGQPEQLLRCYGLQLQLALFSPINRLFQRNVVGGTKRHANGFTCYLLYVDDRKYSLHLKIVKAIEFKVQTKIIAIIIYFPISVKHHIHMSCVTRVSQSRYIFLSHVSSNKQTIRYLSNGL